MEHKYLSIYMLPVLRLVNLSAAWLNSQLLGNPVGKPAAEGEKTVD